MSPNTTPLVSIVIVVLNAADGLQSTLASIERQGDDALAKIEIEIVDGGSTDGTLDVARASSLRVHLTSGPDSGIYDAMNTGAARSRGHWIHFLNAGDVFADEQALATVLDGLTRAKTNRRTWFIAGARIIGGGMDGLLIPNLPHKWYRHALGLQPHCHQAMWFDRGMFVAIGGYSLDYGFVGDFDLIVRWGATGDPETDSTVVIGYLWGGLSVKRETEIPALLRRVRMDRMQLSPIAAAQVETLIRSIRQMDRVRGVVGHLRERLSTIPRF